MTSAKVPAQDEIQASAGARSAPLSLLHLWRTSGDRRSPRAGEAVAAVQAAISARPERRSWGHIRPPSGHPRLYRAEQGNQVAGENRLRDSESRHSRLGFGGATETEGGSRWGGRPTRVTVAVSGHRTGRADSCVSVSTASAETAASAPVPPSVPSCMECRETRRDFLTADTQRVSPPAFGAPDPRGEPPLRGRAAPRHCRTSSRPGLPARRSWPGPPRRRSRPGPP
jgi:hypothetical protein